MRGRPCLDKLGIEGMEGHRSIAVEPRFNRRQFAQYRPEGRRRRMKGFPACSLAKLGLSSLRHHCNAEGCSSLAKSVLNAHQLHLPEGIFGANTGPYSDPPYFTAAHPCASPLDVGNPHPHFRRPAGAGGRRKAPSGRAATHLRSSRFSIFRSLAAPKNNVNRFGFALF